MTLNAHHSEKKVYEIQQTMTGTSHFCYLLWSIHHGKCAKISVGEAKESLSNDCHRITLYQRRQLSVWHDDVRQQKYWHEGQPQQRECH